jgi:hypothetical protein
MLRGRAAKEARFYDNLTVGKWHQFPNHLQVFREGMTAIALLYTTV